MKKVLALVLALAMILGCFSFVSAAEFSDVAADADFHDAAVVLSDLGVASGYTDGTFKPEKVVTRAEMAAFIVKALGIAPAASATTTFSDVPATHWASGYIAYATSLGIVSGYTDGTFKPDQTVSYDQAITMLVQALGYTAESLTGTYPAAYVSKAKALGITDGVEALGTAGANRGDVAQLLYNTLNQSIGHVDNDGYWAPSVNKDNKNDNMFARLGATLITDTDGKTAKAFIVDEEKVENAVVDLSSYLGKVVTAYQNKSGEIVAVFSAESTTITGKINTERTKIGDYKLKGVKENAEVLYFLNGDSTTVTFGAIADSTTFTYDVDLDGNYVKAVYSVQKWKTTKEDKIDAAGVKALADKDTLFGYEFVMTSKDEIDTTSFVLEGVDSLADIKKNDIVAVYVRPVDNTVSKVQVGTEIVTGKITKLNAKQTTATIEGKSYDMASGKFPTAAFSATYDFHLNFDGDVFYAEKVTEDTTEAYGIVMNVYAETVSSDWQASTASGYARKISIFTTEGKTVTYDVENDYDNGAFETLPTFTTKGFIEANTLVEYELDEEGMLVKIAAVGTAPKKDLITEKKTIDGNYFATDAVIFAYDSADDEWSVVSVASAAGDTLTNAKVVVDDGLVVAVSTGLKKSDNDAVYGVYTGMSQIGTSKWNVSFMIDGVEETYEVKTQPTFVFDGLLGKVEYTGDTPSKFTTEAAITTIGAITDDASFKNNTYTPDGENYYAIDEDVFVYFIDDDDEISVVKADDVADYLTNDDYTVSMWAHEQDQAKTGLIYVYDYVIVYE